MSAKAHSQNVHKKVAASLVRILTATLLILNGLVSVLLVIGGTFFTFAGSIFYNTPTSSYPLFISEVLGIPLLIEALFLVSLFLHSKHRYRASYVLSVSVLILILLYAAGIFVFGQGIIIHYD